MTEPKQELCGQCQGENSTPDNHPKWHYGNESFHFDCVPQRVLDDEASDSAHHEHALALRKAALDGKHGDDLRKYALTLAKRKGLHATEPTEEN